MKNSLLKNNLLFLIGLLSAFYVRIIGSLIVGEIIVMLLFLCLIINRQVIISYKNKDIRVYTGLLLLAALSSIVSALYRELDTTSTLKGFFTILLLIPGLYVFHWLLNDRPYRIVYYLAGMIISTILTIHYFPEFSMYEVNDYLSLEEAMEIQWTYVYLPYFMFAIAFFYQKYPKITAFSMIGMGFFLLYGMGRRSFLIFLIASVVLLFTGGKNIGKTLTGKKKFIIIILLCIGGLVAKYAYEDLAQRGVLGENAQRKYEMQARTKIGLFSGRSKLISGLITLTHHPIMGIGTYGNTVEDSREITLKFYELTGLYSDDIYAHSAMFDWWLCFGILALPFWIYVLKQCRIFFKNIYAYPQLTAYMLTGVLYLLWDVFFSPFANRIGYATILILMLIIKSQNKHNDAIPAINSNSNI
jgi:hypothetical protein